jgi:TctA family transporter
MARKTRGSVAGTVATAASILLAVVAGIRLSFFTRALFRAIECFSLKNYVAEVESGFPSENPSGIL